MSAWRIADRDGADPPRILYGCMGCGYRRWSPDGAVPASCRCPKARDARPALQARCHKCGHPGELDRAGGGWFVRCEGCLDLSSVRGHRLNPPEAWLDWNAYQAAREPHGSAHIWESWWVEGAPCPA